jgi:hypothetical protein
LIFGNLRKNQKNVLAGILQQILGDYCQIIQSSTDNIDKNVKVYLIDSFEFNDDEVDECLLKIYENNTFGVPVVLCNEPAITFFVDDWFWRRVLVVTNPYDGKMKPPSSVMQKSLIRSFLQPNQDFKIPSNILDATKNYRTFCESYETIKIENQIAHIPKIIKETNIYSLFKDIELKGVTLRNVDLRGMNMSHIWIRDCDFTGSNFRGCNFDFATIERTTMCDVDFRIVSMLDGKMSHVDFTGAKFDDANFNKCTAYRSNFTDVNMCDMQIDSVSYRKCIGR